MPYQYCFTAQQLLAFNCIIGFRSTGNPANIGERHCKRLGSKNQPGRINTGKTRAGRLETGKRNLDGDFFYCTPGREILLELGPEVELVTAF